MGQNQISRLAEGLYHQDPPENVPPFKHLLYGLHIRLEG